MQRYLCSTVAVAVLATTPWPPRFIRDHAYVSVELMSSRAQDDAILAAKVTLAALTVFHADTKSLKLDTVRLGRSHLSLAEAARHMAELQKPVRCRGTVLTGVLEVDCQPITDATELEDWRLWVEGIAWENADFIRRAYGSGAEPRILVDLGLHPVVITAGVFERWQREYHLPGLAFGLGDRDARLEALGADAVVRFWPSGNDKFKSGPLFSPPRE